jgi:hypothetical protein
MAEPGVGVTSRTPCREALALLNGATRSDVDVLPPLATYTASGDWCASVLESDRSPPKAVAALSAGGAHRHAVSAPAHTGTLLGFARFCSLLQLSTRPEYDGPDGAEVPPAARLASAPSPRAAWAAAYGAAAAQGVCAQQILSPGADPTSWLSREVLARRSAAVQGTAATRGAATKGDEYRDDAEGYITEHEFQRLPRAVQELLRTDRYTHLYNLRRSGLHPSSRTFTPSSAASPTPSGPERLAGARRERRKVPPPPPPSLPEMTGDLDAEMVRAHLRDGLPVQLSRAERATLRHGHVYSEYLQVDLSAALGLATLADIVDADPRADGQPWDAVRRGTLMQILGSRSCCYHLEGTTDLALGIVGDAARGGTVQVVPSRQLTQLATAADPRLADPALVSKVFTLRWVSLAKLCVLPDDVGVAQRQLAELATLPAFSAETTVGAIDAQFGTPSPRRR